MPDRREDTQTLPVLHARSVRRARGRAASRFTLPAGMAPGTHGVGRTPRGEVAVLPTPRAAGAPLVRRRRNNDWPQI